MPKLKRKTKKVASKKAPAPPKKSEMDTALEEYRADPSYTRYDNHSKAAEFCAITGISYKTQAIVYVQSPEFHGWCCLDASTMMLLGKPLDEIKAELSIKFRPKSIVNKLKRKLRA